MSSPKKLHFDNTFPRDSFTDEMGDIAVPTVLVKEVGHDRRIHPVDIAGRILNSIGPNTCHKQSSIETLKTKKSMGLAFTLSHTVMPQGG